MADGIPPRRVGGPEMSELEAVTTASAAVRNAIPAMAIQSVDWLQAPAGDRAVASSMVLALCCFGAQAIASAPAWISLCSTRWIRPSARG